MDSIQNLLAAVGSHLCGQTRCFWADAAPLPLCQRCLGLYAGLGLAFVWGWTTGLRRRGLPPPGVFLWQVGLLLIALSGGLHWIDPGPVWRVACGLWTGWTAAIWLIGGASQLGLQGKTSPLPWRSRDRLGALVAGPLLALMASLLATLPALGYWPALTPALLGIALLAVWIVRTILAVAQFAFAQRTPGA